MLKQHRVWFLFAAVAAVVMILGMWPRHYDTQAQEQAGPPPTIHWQLLQQTGTPSGGKTYRAAVPGGWLICVNDSEERSRRAGNGVGHGIGVGVGVTFVPDPEHEWK